MSNEYKAQARISSAVAHTEINLTIPDLAGIGSVNFAGTSSSLNFPGANGTWGTVFTDDIVRLTRDTVTFKYQVVALVVFNITFYDRNGNDLGRYTAYALGSVSGIGEGTGKWDNVVTDEAARLAAKLAAALADAQAAALAAAFSAGAIVGVGMDTNLWLRQSLNSSWTRVPNSASVFAVAANADGSLWGLGTNPPQRLWKRATLTSGWQGPLGGGQFLAITGTPDGNLLGVGTDNFLYSVDAAGNCNQVPGSGSVTAVAAMKDGSIIGIGMDRQLYKRATLGSIWKAFSAGQFLAITAMGNGLLGVGMDNCLYTIDTVGSWSQVPNSASVMAVACHP